MTITSGRRNMLPEAVFALELQSIFHFHRARPNRVCSLKSRDHLLRNFPFDDDRFANLRNNCRFVEFHRRILPVETNKDQEVRVVGLPNEKMWIWWVRERNEKGKRKIWAGEMKMDECVTRQQSNGDHQFHHSNGERKSDLREFDCPGGGLKREPSDNVT